MESAPTGCFKCGRPGHWSRDCPSSAPVAGSNAASSSSAPSSQIPNNVFQRSSAKKGTSVAPVSKVTKTRVQRPKLTPTMLLSEDGLGYVLRYFPKSFKYRGRGKEASLFLFPRFDQSQVCFIRFGINLVSSEDFDISFVIGQRFGEFDKVVQ